MILVEGTGPYGTLLYKRCRLFVYAFFRGKADWYLRIYILLRINGILPLPYEERCGVGQRPVASAAVAATLAEMTKTRMLVNVSTVPI